MENMELENNTQVLFFKGVKEWGLDQDYSKYEEGRIIRSEIMPIMQTAKGNIEATVCYVELNNGKTVSGTHTYFGGNDFVLTPEEYVEILNAQIERNNNVLNKILNRQMVYSQKSPNSEKYLNETSEEYGRRNGEIQERINAVTKKYNLEKKLEK